MTARGGFGKTSIYDRGIAGSFFAHDDWRISSNVTLNLGLRYELFLPFVEKFNEISNFDPKLGDFVVAGRGGVGRELYSRDLNNFAPRVGFAWRPFNNASMSIRAGYGVFYDVSTRTGIMINMTGNPPFARRETFTASSTTPNIFLSDPFPAALVQVSISRRAVQRDNWRYTYMQQWNLGIQREFGGVWAFELGYVGSKGSKLERSRNINQPRPGAGAIGPRPQFQAILLAELAGSSIYHSLQGRLQKNLSHGLSFLTSYTWPRSIDDVATPQNAYNVVERGLSDFDARHRLVVNYIYQLPFGRGRRFLSNTSGHLATIFIEGWELSGISTFQSGRPVNPRVTADIANTGDRPQCPNLIGDWKRSNPDPASWFNEQAFVVPPRFTFGNAGRNIIIGPGTNNTDLSLIKNHSMGERRNLQFRFEMFNLANHSNFDQPNANADSPQFGKIFSTIRSMRQIQLGLRVTY